MAENSDSLPPYTAALNHAAENSGVALAAPPLGIRRFLIFGGVLLLVVLLIYVVLHRRWSAMTETNPVIPQSDRQVNREVNQIPAESIERGFEARSVNLRGVVIFAVTLLVAIALIAVVLWWMVSSWKEQTLLPHAQIPPVNVTVQPAPGAFPVINPTGNLATVVNGALGNLNSYGWVDKKAGVVRIPIDQAMTLLLQRGLPARKANPPGFGLDNAHKLDSEGGQDPQNEFTMR
ncbi:MAG: hypothetical protein U0350_17765 [Caldilineaceae bacterium]